MKELQWDLLKSQRLKRARGVSFEELVHAKLVAVKRHPTRAHQQLMLFEHRGHIWVAPYVESGDAIFLKTLYPSRKYTALYRRGALR